MLNQPLPPAGMNHSQFGSGKERPLMPGAPQLDIDPDISHDDAVSEARIHSSAVPASQHAGSAAIRRCPPASMLAQLPSDAAQLSALNQAHQPAAVDPELETPQFMPPVVGRLWWMRSLGDSVLHSSALFP